MSQGIAFTVGMVDNYRMMNYVLVVGFVCNSLEYIQSLPDEVRLLWPRKLSWIKALFLLSRYLPWVWGPLYMFASFYPSITSLACSVVFKVGLGAVVANVAAAEVIMYIRAYALCKSNRKVGIYLAAQFIFLHGVIFAMAGLHLTTLGFQSSQLPNLVTCIFDHPHTLYMTILKACILWSESSVTVIGLIIGLPEHQSHSRSFKLYKAFHQDGIVYFVIMAGITGANIVLHLIAPMELKFMLSAPAGYLHSILSSRLILHFHAISERELKATHPSTINPQSTLHFKPPKDVEESRNFFKTTFDDDTGQVPTFATDDTRCVSEWFPDKAEMNYLGSRWSVYSGATLVA